MPHPSEAAAALGRLARGVPKKFSAAELERRRRRLAEARKSRWPGKAAAPAKKRK